VETPKRSRVRTAQLEEGESHHEQENPRMLEVRIGRGDINTIV